MVSFVINVSLSRLQYGRIRFVFAARLFQVLPCPPSEVEYRFNFGSITDYLLTGFAHRWITGGIIRHYGSAIKPTEFN
jgi:hypothetical protein